MNRPFVVCHMICSLDGKIDGEFMTVPQAKPALQEYGKLREFYQCQATLYGTTTMARSFSDGFAPELPSSEIKYPQEDYISHSHEHNYIVSIDPQGILGWSSNVIQKRGRSKAHVIEVLTEQTSPAYLAYLRQLDISYIFAGKTTIDCSLLLKKLKKLFQIERLMIAGGAIVNWSFLQENLIDELSLVIAPVADGNTTSVSIFERSKFSAGKTPVSFQLKEVKRIAEDGLWLRYIVR